MPRTSDAAEKIRVGISIEAWLIGSLSLAVEKGFAAAGRGELIEEEEMDARLEAMLERRCAFVVNRNIPLLMRFVKVKEREFMEMLPVKPERKAQLDDYAKRHGYDAAAALDEVLANYLEWEQQDYQESVEAIRKGYEDVKAGRTRPAAKFIESLRDKYGFPR